MTYEEAIKTIQIAIAEVEWNYPMEYSIAFETAIEALKKCNKAESGESCWGCNCPKMLRSNRLE